MKGQKKREKKNNIKKRKEKLTLKFLKSEEKYLIYSIKSESEGQVQVEGAVLAHF